MSTTTQSTARSHAPLWRAEANDLAAMAHDVHVAQAPRSAFLTPAEVAKAMIGPVHYVTIQFGQERLQRACAELARAKDWDSSLSSSAEVTMLSVSASGLRDLAGMDSLRAALAFWATCSDPAVWQRVLGL